MITKVLIANRGEIACRVIATCKRLGIKTVAVFSDADANAQHVALADEAVNIGPPSVAESYLRGDHIIEVAKAVGAEGIHPGYGFLSENAGFSESCAEAGIAFIGPPASAIRSMGDKAASKHIMIAANVPCTGGYHGDDQALETIATESERIGYPVMLKAVLGGGGKGMRIVKTAEELPALLESCQREGQASFGDPRILVEKYIPRSRHIELQVFADTHGNCVHLFERDCSIQRRHQKVLEEAPAPGMTDELRLAMGDAAVNAARAVGYVGAGTVEFMLDVTTNDFYFCEMNTRLQVEHPVSEMITGVDLVEWQLLAASGMAIPLPTQEHVNAQFRGHSIEARVYAEDTRGGFMPQAGHLAVVQAPAEEEGRLRVETGVRTGDDVSVHYDPMISKLVVWAEDRDAALAKMEAALGEYVIIGPPNNLEFVKSCVMHEGFQKGGVDTAFIEEHEAELLPDITSTWPAQGSDAMARITALGALACLLPSGSALQHAPTLDPTSPWNLSALDGFRVMPEAHATQRLRMRPTGVMDGDAALEVAVDAARQGDGSFMMSVDGSDGFEVRVVLLCVCARARVCVPLLS